MLREKVISKLIVNWAASFLSVLLLMSMVALPALAAVAANSVNSSSIVDGSIRTRDIKKNAVNSSRIRNYSIRKEDIHSGSINKYKLTSNSVNTFKIEDGAIKNQDIADGAVNSAKIADSSITNTDIANGANISDAKISYSTKTGYLAVPPSALSPSIYDTQYRVGSFLYNDDANQAFFVAPVYLPNGAKVTKLSYQAYDNTGGGWTYVNFRRTSNGASETIAATGASIDTGVWETYSTSAINNQIIDNSSYAYYVLVFLSGGQGANIKAGKIVIEYTYTTPGG